MECRQAYFYLNIRGRAADELGPETTAELDRHLASCPDCAAFARYLRAEDDALARAMKAVPVPAGLKDRLHRGLNERLASRRRRRSYRLAAMAACLAIGVSLVFGYQALTRQNLDLTKLVYKADSDFTQPDEATKQWLAERGLPDRLPLAFDYALLVLRGGESLQGRDVPFLVFYNPQTRQKAIVYICKDQQYAGLKATPDAMASYFRTTTLRDEERFPGISFIVLHNSDDLKPFLRTQDLPA